MFLSDLRSRDYLLKIGGYKVHSSSKPEISHGHWSCMVVFDEPQRIAMFAYLTNWAKVEGIFWFTI